MLGVAGWDLASFPGMSRGTICRWVCLPSCLRSSVGLAPGERNITRCVDRRSGVGGRRADSGVLSSALGAPRSSGRGVCVGDPGFPTQAGIRSWEGSPHPAVSFRERGASAWSPWL